MEDKEMTDEEFGEYIRAKNERERWDKVFYESWCAAFGLKKDWRPRPLSERAEKYLKKKNKII